MLENDVNFSLIFLDDVPGPGSLTMSYSGLLLLYSSSPWTTEAENNFCRGAHSVPFGKQMESCPWMVDAGQLLGKEVPLEAQRRVTHGENERTTHNMYCIPPHKRLGASKSLGILGLRCNTSFFRLFNSR